ncbi:MAG: hypothetical protein ACO3CR_03630 [Solirubrobacterales bacterium]
MPVRRFAPIALASILAASSLVLVACGSDSNDGERQAAAGPKKAWSGTTGNTANAYRGVEVEIINSRRVNNEPLIVGIAADGYYCPKSPTPNNRCGTRRGGTEPRDVWHNFFARWEAYAGEILQSVDAKDSGKFESLIRWNRGPGYANQVGFSVINPGIGRPYVRLYSNDSCPRIGTKKFALKEGRSETLIDNTDRCQVEFKVTRRGDTDLFKRYTIEVF